MIMVLSHHIPLLHIIKRTYKLKLPSPLSFLVPSSTTIISVFLPEILKLGPKLFFCIVKALAELFCAVKVTTDGPFKRGYFR